MLITSTSSTSGTPVQFPTKECLILNKKVYDPVGERGAGDTGKREVFLCTLSIQLFLVLGSSKQLGLGHHASCCPAPLATRQQEANTSLPSFCPLTYHCKFNIWFKETTPFKTPWKPHLQRALSATSYLTSFNKLLSSLLPQIKNSVI